MSEPTGWMRLKTIMGALSDAAMCSPRVTEPYVLRRKVKGGPSTNAIPCRRAVRLMQRVDPTLGRIATWLEKRSDGLYTTERKCELCGAIYEPLPNDTGVCWMCILDEGQARG